MYLYIYKYTYIDRYYDEQTWTFIMTVRKILVGTFFSFIAKRFVSWLFHVFKYTGMHLVTLTEIDSVKRDILGGIYW